MINKKDIKEAIYSLINECLDESAKKYPILNKIFETENTSFSTDEEFGSYLTTLFNHATKYDCECYESFLNKLNNKFLTSDFEFEKLSDDAKEFCVSEKWFKGNFKFTPVFISECQINEFLNKIRFSDVTKIYQHINKFILNIYKYGVISDFTDFFLLVYEYEINPENIEILVDSDFEVWLYELFGAKHENIEKVYKWDAEIKELGYKGPVIKNEITSELERPKFMSNPKKFDLVIGNPPYGKKNVKLDLNILQSIFKFSKKIIFIHPSTFIFDKKFKWKQYNDVRNTNYLEKIITLWGNVTFNIGLFCPLCISSWDTSKTNNEVEVIDNAITKTSYKTKINDVCIHGSSKIMNNFLKKIYNHISIYGNLQSNINVEKNIKQTDYSVKFAIIRGHADKEDRWNDDIFTLICKDYNDNFCDKTFLDYENLANTQKLIWSFDNNDIRLNFINYCKSKFTRFCLSFKKASQNIANGELELIPWLDFTQEWNDAKLCKEFGISEELWNYIDNFIPNYYDDYKSGFEKEEK